VPSYTPASIVIEITQTVKSPAPARARFFVLRAPGPATTSALGSSNRRRSIGACSLLVLLASAWPVAGGAAEPPGGPRDMPAQDASGAPRDLLAVDVQAWRQRVREQIQQKLSLPLGVPQDARVELEVSLLPTGHVADVSTRRASGSAELDTAVRRAVLAATPLDLPADAEGYERLRRFGVTFEPGAGLRMVDPLPQQGQAGAAPAPAERFACNAASAGPATAPNCSHSGSRGELANCYVQALQRRVVKMVAACGAAAYPMQARKNRWEGTVQVAVAFERGGKFGGVSLAESSGQPMLDQRALQMVNEAMLPAPAELFATAFAVRVPVTFRMQHADPEAKTSGRQM
jgi:TonB family protein